MEIVKDYLCFFSLLNANVNNVDVMIVKPMYNFLILLIYFLFSAFWIFPIDDMHGYDLTFF